MTDVALDRAGGGVFVVFRLRGVTSADTSRGSADSCTGDRTFEEPLSKDMRPERAGGGDNVDAGGTIGGESLGRGGGGGGECPGGGGW